VSTQNSYDPSKVTHLGLWITQNTYPRHDEFVNREHYRQEILVSMVLRSCLNICEHIEEEWIVHSVPLDLTAVKEQLTLSQILADFVLYHLITWDTDRDLCWQNDYRSKEWENISTHNCRIWPNGTYSIFDLEWDFVRIEKKDIEFLIIQYIKDLLSPDKYDSPITHESIGPDLWLLDDEELVDRMLKTSKILLDQYDNPEWKIFFLKQSWMAFQWRNTNPNLDLSTKEDIWYDEDLERYNDFIFTTRNIHEHLSENYEELFCGTSFTRRTLKVEISKSFQLLRNWIKKYVRSFLPD
jgi:hypothetical protein